jgi:hypothetical protein
MGMLANCLNCILQIADEIILNSDKHNNVCSRWDGVQPGFPQDLVLGLCLSVVCIDDFPHSIIAICSMFNVQFIYIP